MSSTNVTPREFASYLTFGLLAFGLFWAIEIPANLEDRGVLHIHLSTSLRTVAQIAPAIAALLTVGWLEGARAVKSLLASIVLIKAPLRWYALILLGPFAAWAAAMLIYHLWGRPIPVLGPWFDVPLIALLGAPLSLGEELGWRGFLLERLMRKNSLLVATGWISLWWGLWHLPVHLVQNDRGFFFLFLLGMFPVSAVFTLLYSRTRSVFLCVLLHTSIDAGASYWTTMLPEGDLLYLALADAVLWLAAIPVFVVLAKPPRAEIRQTQQAI